MLYNINFFSLEPIHKLSSEKSQNLIDDSYIDNNSALGETKAGSPILKSPCPTVMSRSPSLSGCDVITDPSLGPEEGGASRSMKSSIETPMTGTLLSENNNVEFKIKRQFFFLGGGGGGGGGCV